MHISMYQWRLRVGGEGGCTVAASFMHKLKTKANTKSALIWSACFCNISIFKPALVAMSVFTIGWGERWYFSPSGVIEQIYSFIISYYFENSVSFAFKTTYTDRNIMNCFSLMWNYLGTVFILFSVSYNNYSTINSNSKDTNNYSAYIMHSKRMARNLPSMFSLSLMCWRLHAVSSLLRSDSWWYGSSLEWAFLRSLGLPDTQQEVVLPISPPGV